MDEPRTGVAESADAVASAPLRPAPDPLTVRMINDAAELAALLAAWPRVAGDGPGAVFRSPAWWTPWWRHLGGGGRVSRSGPRLASPSVWRGSRLLGVLPAWRARGPLGLRTLRLLGDGIVGSDHLGVVSAPADADEVAE